MALFIDGPPATLDDLTGQDSHALEMASAEGIDLGGRLQQAYEEMTVELSAWLSRGGPADRTSPGAGPWLGQVIATTPLRMWHTLRTLEMAYVEAYCNQLNERYRAKRDEFRRMTGWAYDKALELGLGIVGDPIRRAATPLAQNAAGNLPAGIYYVAAAWINRAGEEGECGTPAVISTSNNTFTARLSGGAANAAGWNVYAGPDAETTTLQNPQPIAAGAVWTQPNALTTTGRPAGTGQAPNWTFATARMLRRG